MNKELFASMREQMGPSGEAREALSEKLAAPRKKSVPLGRYAAIAACAAVIIAAVPVYGMAQNYLEKQKNWAVIVDSSGNSVTVEIREPHNYALADETACWPEDAVTGSNTTADGAGDQDQDMTPGELTDNMLEAGFTQEDVDGYLASGWQMTWAKWWKFYHQTEESGDWSLEALLDFSREEGLAVNTGEADVPGGAYVGGTPDQGEAVMAYQNLMDRFKAECGPDQYPEWYGGAYIDEHAELIVNIVEDYESEDKELFFQIWDWAGSDKVGFGSCPFSMTWLKELQGEVIAAMEELGLAAGCGIDEEAGQVELTLPEATEEALWKLAELDPEGTAIRVVVGQFAATDDLAEEPALIAPSVSNTVQSGGDDLDPGTPVSNTDGMIVDGDGVIAWEPQG